MKVVRTDGSRIDKYQSCPRARWWGYEYGGRGLQSSRLSLPLLTGSAGHEGLAFMLMPASGDLEHAVAHARRWYEKKVREAEIDLEQSEDQFYVAQEQMALTEGLLRCFAKTTLPRLLEEFEVLEVEREEDEILVLHGDGETWTELRLMGRVDALVRERSSGDLYLWSFKTTATWDKRKDKSAEHDQQGLSEAWLLEQRLGEKIMGVQMIHLVKGRRAEHPKGSGRWVTFSPLIRGYRRHGTVGTEYAHSWEWDDVDGSHRLSGKWERFDVWTDYAGGVKQWIEDLDALMIQPQAPSPLEAQILTPMPYFRQPEDMQNWLDSTRAQELRVAERSSYIQGAIPTDLSTTRLLNEHFPQYRHSCHYPSDCQFLRLCFGSEDYRRDPVGTGDFKWRSLNHPIEAESLPTSKNKP